jgi:hypothetical protein
VEVELGPDLPIIGIGFQKGTLKEQSNLGSGVPPSNCVQQIHHTYNMSYGTAPFLVLLPTL